MAIAIRVLRDGVYQYTAIPQNTDDGRFQGKREYHEGGEVNGHPLRDRMGDLMASVLSLHRLPGMGVNEWLRAHCPSATRVAETRAESVAMGRRSGKTGVWSDNGRGPPILDAAPFGAGFNVKSVSSDGHKACLLTTPKHGPGGAEDQINDLVASNARLYVLAIRSTPYDGGMEGEVVIDLAALEWQIVPVVSVWARMGGLPGMAGASGGRGRKPAGWVFPDAWATRKRTTCVDGSWSIYQRIGDRADADAWTHGDLEDLHRAIEAAAR